MLINRRARELTSVCRHPQTALCWALQVIMGPYRPRIKPPCPLSFYVGVKYLERHWGYCLYIITQRRFPIFLLYLGDGNLIYQIHTDGAS